MDRSPGGSNTNSAAAYVNEFGIANSTLEEVFLNLTQGDEAVVSLGGALGGLENGDTWSYR